MLDCIREDEAKTYHNQINPGFFSVKNNSQKRKLRQSQTAPRKVTKVFTPGSYSLRRDDRKSLGDRQEIILTETQPFDPYPAADPASSSSPTHSIPGPSSEVSNESMFPINKKEKILTGDKIKKQSQQEKLIKREQDILKAVDYHKKGNSIRAAAKKFGLPKSTISDRVNNRCKTVKGRLSPVFTRQEEVKLAKAIDFRASLGVGLDYYQLSLIIQRSLLDLVTANPERITSLEKTNQYPSYDYCVRFARRNNLVLRCFSELNKGREQLTEEELREWQHATGLMMNENKDIISNPAIS